MLPPGGYVAPTFVFDASHCFQAKSSCCFEFEFKSEFSLVTVGSAPGSSVTLPTPVPTAIFDISYGAVVQPGFRLQGFNMYIWHSLALSEGGSPSLVSKW